jgi:hypothetical protein
MKTFKQIIQEGGAQADQGYIQMNPNQSELNEESHAMTLIQHLRDWKFFEKLVKFNYLSEGAEAVIEGKDGYTYSIQLSVKRKI